MPLIATHLPAMPVAVPVSRMFPASLASVPLPGVAAQMSPAIVHGLLAPVIVIVDVFFSFYSLVVVVLGDHL